MNTPEEIEQKQRARQLQNLLGTVSTVNPTDLMHEVKPEIAVIVPDPLKTSHTAEDSAGRGVAEAEFNDFPIKEEPLEEEEERSPQAKIPKSDKDKMC